MITSLDKVANVRALDVRRLNGILGVQVTSNTLRMLSVVDVQLDVPHDVCRHFLIRRSVSNEHGHNARSKGCQPVCVVLVISRPPIR